VQNIRTKVREKIRGLHRTFVTIDINRRATVESNVDVGYAVADGARCPFASDPFDYLHCDQVLKHLPDTGVVSTETTPGTVSAGRASRGVLQTGEPSTLTFFFLAGTFITTPGLFSTRFGWTCDPGRSRFAHRDPSGGRTRCSNCRR
jgi:hypothetical protein